MGAVAHAYRSFAIDNPSLYDAMFTRTTRLRFGAEDTPAPLRAAFDEIRESVAALGSESETLTEVLWAALHGLTTLSRNDRLRPGHDHDRIDLLVTHICGRG